MSASRSRPTPPPHTTVQPTRYKSACDQCHDSKVKCDGASPLCKRCADTGQPCRYSVAARTGKPPGSRNRKTLERLRRASVAASESRKVIATSNGSIPGDIGNASSGHHEASDNGIRDGDLSRELLQISETSKFPESSSTNDCRNFFDQPQAPAAPVQDFFNTDPGHPGGNGLSLLATSLECGEPGVAGRIDAPMSRERAADDGWGSLSPNTTQQLLPSVLDAEMPPNIYANESIPQSDESVSLDFVIAQLDNAGTSTETSSQTFESRSMLCYCLRNYTSILYQLQTIERSQHPVRIDILLTCLNFILSIIEKHGGCSKCLSDSRVLMQLVMIFQTILTWTQSHRYAQETFDHDTCITLGRYRLGHEEESLVKASLMVRALKRTGIGLGLVRSRVEYISMPSQQRSKPLQGDNGIEPRWLVQLISSLMERYNGLKKIFELKWEELGCK